jgi:hypothetical protein
MTDNRKITEPGDENLSLNAPNLFGIEQGNEFIVPEGYFENLPLQIQSRLTTPGDKKFYHSARTRWIMAVSAVVTAVVVILIVVLPATRQSNIQAPPASAQSAVTSDYADYIDESSIVEVMLDGQVPNPFEIADNNQPKIMLGNTEFTRDEIVNYLVETDHNDQLIHEDLGQ